MLASAVDSSSQNASTCLSLSSSYKQANFCSSCFDEVCSRCSTDGDDGVLIRKEVRINEKPFCEEPRLGATAPLKGTTVENLTLDEGYFRTSNQSHDILQCYRKSACQGGNDAYKYCAPGYTGPCENEVEFGSSRSSVC